MASKHENQGLKIGVPTAASMAGSFLSGGHDLDLIQQPGLTSIHISVDRCHDEHFTNRSSGPSRLELRST